MKNCFFSAVFGLFVCNFICAQNVASTLEEALRSDNSQITQDLFALLMLKLNGAINSSWQPSDNSLDELELVFDPKLKFVVKPIKPPHFNKLSEMADYSCPQPEVKEPAPMTTSLDFLIEPTLIPKPKCINKPSVDGQIFLVTKEPLSVNRPEPANIEIKGGMPPDEVLKRYNDAQAAYQQHLKAYEKYQADLQEFSKFCTHQEALNQYQRYQQQEAKHQDYCNKKIAYENNLEEIKKCQKYADLVHIYQTYKLQKEVYDKIQSSRGKIDVDKFDVKGLEDINDWLNILGQQYKRDSVSYINFAEQKKRYDRYEKLSKNGILINGAFYYISNFLSEIKRENHRWGYDKDEMNCSSHNKI